MTSLVAVMILLAISASTALYIYLGSANLSIAHSPRRGYGYGYLVCYNVTGYTVSLGDGIRRCSEIDAGGSHAYLCVARVPHPANISIAFSGSLAHAYVDDACVLLLGEAPLYAYAVNSDTYTVLEVKVYEPWAR